MVHHGGSKSDSEVMTDSTDSDGSNPRRHGDGSARPKRPKTAAHEARRGKWSGPEEAYAARLIRDFEGGLLALDNGSTLRAFLSKQLNCSAMRISKKFAGEKCLGKQIYAKRDVDDATRRAEDALLLRLEVDFHASIRGGGAQHAQASPHQRYPHAAAALKPAAPAMMHYRHDAAVVTDQGSDTADDRSHSASEDDVVSEEGVVSPSAPRNKRHLSGGKDAVDADFFIAPLARATLVDGTASSLCDDLESLCAAGCAGDDDDMSEQSMSEASDIDASLDGAAAPLAFRQLGSSARLSSWFFTSAAPTDSREAAELAEARRRANRHNSKCMGDLPRADLIQSPPTALMLELAPGPRAKPPHASLGPYACSIARGTSSASLARHDSGHSLMGLIDGDDGESMFADDFAAGFFDDDDDDVAAGGYQSYPLKHEAPPSTALLV
mmetsp:Transcript_18419/g.62082  ORF Transcript_18419/g.62082 Transcript_18419/m.62082 type:complete len:439 (-) Transcript_18419:178-1494(-)